ncbi:MAG TPA: hypothetical protein VEV17_25585 [Bryobacteraceae bacterium]|nr:hypothetical protein [Bryobacteraceae bacterium]
MLKLRQIVLGLAVQAAALAADPGLLRLVMPDAKVIAGMQVDQTKNSLFGQYVLDHMQVDDASFQRFVAGTGFDPRHDVSEILIASNWGSAAPQSRWLVLAKGVFDVHRILRAAESRGAHTSNYQGADLFTFSDNAPPAASINPPATAVENAIAFFDSGTAAMGDLPSVKAAIDRRRNNTSAANQVVAKVRDLSAKNDFWFATLVPLAEFADAMPDPNLGGAMRTSTFAAVTEVSGGIRFGDTVTISAEAITRSEKDAQALVDVVKFVASMLQMNRQDNQTAGQVASLLDALSCQTRGNVMTMSLAIPERQLEQMMEQMQQQSRPRGKPTPPPSN